MSNRKIIMNYVALKQHKTSQEYFKSLLLLTVRMLTNHPIFLSFKFATSIFGNPNLSSRDSLV